MRHTVKMPRAGETAEVVVILEWLVEPGSRIAAGDPLVTVETDKVSVDIAAPVGGTLVELLAQPDDEVPIGSPICVIES
ncbi:MAG: hypothetical protein KatS3mg011_1759 [Acidimicrobiia bacterium]|nr:MAG: hypothetical protein KatS3mg011_1759 [Acidimicrobiia bacterium]